jgi:hypothetical protein
MLKLVPFVPTAASGKEARNASDVRRPPAECGVVVCARSVVAIAELRRQHSDPHRFALVDVSRDEVRAWAAEVLQGGPRAATMALCTACHLYCHR